MKKTIALALTIATLKAVDIKIAWDTPIGCTIQDLTNSVMLNGITNTLTQYADLSGYWIYHSTSVLSGYQRIQAVAPNATNATLTNLSGGTHFFYLTATNALSALESVPSNLIQTPLDAPKASGLKLFGK